MFDMTGYAFTFYIATIRDPFRLGQEITMHSNNSTSNTNTSNNNEIVTDDADDKGDCKTMLMT